MEVMIKRNTLMVCSCLEIQIYYKWTPDKQTDACFPPNVLGDLRCLDGNSTTVIMKENWKCSACHVLPPFPLAQKGSLNWVDKIYIYLELTWNYFNLCWGTNPAWPNPVVTRKQSTAHITCVIPTEASFGLLSLSYNMLCFRSLLPLYSKVQATHRDSARALARGLSWESGCDEM